MDYPLFDSMEAAGEQLVIPDVKSYKDFLAWIKALPSKESPAWSGLPLNVETLNRIKQAEALVNNVKLIQGTGEDDMDGGAADEAGDSKAQWLVSLQKKVTQFTEMMPAALPEMRRDSTSLKNPLFRFLDRENTVLCELLETVKKDFQFCYDVCTAERKSSN